MPRLRESPVRPSPRNEPIPLIPPNVPEADDEATPLVEAETNGHDTVVVEAPAPETPPLEPEDEAKTALSKRVAELEAAEKTRAQEHARQIAEWQQRVQSAEQQRTTARQEASQSREAALQAHADAIANSITAQQELLEAAERDLETAIAGQDAKGQASATKRITMASSYLAQLETSKTQFEAQRESLKTEQPASEPQPVDPIDQMPRLSVRQKDWLKGHRELLMDDRKNRKLGVAHDDAIEAGHAVDTPEYFQFLEERMGYRQPQPEPPADDNEPPPEPPPTPARRSIVSAPVSRSAPSPSTGRRESESRITLSADQREAARLSGVSEVEYAKQVKRLEREKALGNYPMVNQK